MLIETSENLSSVKVSLLNDDICVDDALLVGNDESKKNDSIFQYEEDNELNQSVIVYIMSCTCNIEDDKFAVTLSFVHKQKFKQL